MIGAIASMMTARTHMNEVVVWPLNAITATVARTMALIAPKSATYFLTALKASWMRTSSKCAVPAVVSLVFAMSFFLCLVVVSTLRSAEAARYGPGRTGGWAQTHPGPTRRK